MREEGKASIWLAAALPWGQVEKGGRNLAGGGAHLPLVLYLALFLATMQVKGLCVLARKRASHSQPP